MLKKIILTLVLLFAVRGTFAEMNIPATYAFKFIQYQWLQMPDGTKLSVNYWQPQGKEAQQKFPIVLEILPYRKDDIHFQADYAIGSYLVQHGIGFARVDIRGTGSSQGTTPDREYSDQELQDIREIIKQLAVLPWSNGNIGMQGISWSAFNSIMTAMQRPPQLKGILVAHGSDDIYANDIHNIDGALHLDIFTIEIEVDNILPASPNYKVNKAYITDRFDQKPWIFGYLQHQRDSEFWQKDRSLNTNYAAINIPVYAYASLLDGYRDFAINMLENGKNKIQVAVGPQNHAWPDGSPGPNYEWRQKAVQFWQQVLNGKETGFWQAKPLTVFIRDSVPPNLHLEQTPGVYKEMAWPPREKRKLNLFLQKDHLLAEKPGAEAVDTLLYKPSAGKGVLNWWGETTPDMRDADQDTLIYDSAPLTKDFYLLGKPIVSIKIALDAPFAHWIVRLEDVAPDGKVAFITGGLKNAAQRESRTNPKAVVQNKFFHLDIPMRFTSWKFAKGHRIRLSIGNAQFPMVWPTPYKMTAKLMVGGNTSQLILPLVNMQNLKTPKFPPLEANESMPEVKYLHQVSLTPFEIKHDDKGNITASAKEGYKIDVHGDILEAKYKVFYQVNDINPAEALFVGEGEDTIHVVKENRLVKVQSTIHVQSDKKYFHTTVVRKLFENDKLLRTRTWKESIPRDFQ